MNESLLPWGVGDMIVIGQDKENPDQSNLSCFGPQRSAEQAHTHMHTLRHIQKHACAHSIALILQHMHLFYLFTDKHIHFALHFYTSQSQSLFLLTHSHAIGALQLTDECRCCRQLICCVWSKSWMMLLCNLSQSKILLIYEFDICYTENVEMTNLLIPLSILNTIFLFSSHTKASWLWHISWPNCVDMCKHVAYEGDIHAA